MLGYGRRFVGIGMTRQHKVKRVFHRIHLDYRTASVGSFWMFLTEIDMSDKAPAAHANSNSSTAPLLSLNATIVRY
jgi:hypothetical protein